MTPTPAPQHHTRPTNDHPRPHHPASTQTPNNEPPL